MTCTIAAAQSEAGLESVVECSCASRKAVSFVDYDPHLHDGIILFNQLSYVAGSFFVLENRTRYVNLLGQTASC